MEMKKYLKNGNIIECRNHYRYVVMGNGDFAADVTEFIEDLENIGALRAEEWDIMKIYRPARSTPFQTF